jgi:hypothetical protein
MVDKLVQLVAQHRMQVLDKSRSEASALARCQAQPRVYS